MQKTLPYEGLLMITDLDGTLLTSDKTIAPCDAEAVAKFRAGGGQLSIATGRGLTASESFLQALEPDVPAILYNGSVLYDWQKRRVCYAEYLPSVARDLLSELLQAFPNAGAELLDADGVHVFHDSPQERTHIALTRVRPLYCTLADCQVEICYKALLAADAETVGRMAEYVAQDDHPQFHAVSFTRSHEWLFEMLPARVSKGSGMQALRRVLPSYLRVAASGDFDNDLTMLSAADACACPADAQPEVLQRVTALRGFVSKRTSNDGFFAEWIDRFVRDETRIPL